jgi:transglutaminase-like putative cysteine protease
MSDETKKGRWPFTYVKKSKEPRTQPVITMPKWGNWQQWVYTALLFVTLEIAVLSVELAHWVTPQPLLSLVLVLSVLLTFALVKVRIWGFVKHIILVFAGLLITLWQAMNCLAPTETMSQFTHLINVFQSWFQGTGIALPGDEKIMFVVFITIIAWFVGYLSTWFLLRRNNAWVAVVLGAAIIMFNLTNLPDSYYIYFILYFFAALLLIAVTRMTMKPAAIETTANYSGSSLTYLGVSLLVITVIAASVSWIVPPVRASALQNWIATSTPWQQDVMDSRMNIFNSVAAKTSSSMASLMENLYFRQSWNQGDEVRYIVVSERPSYWRMNSYDTYESWGWTNSLTSKIFLESNVQLTNQEAYAKQELIQYGVYIRLRTDVLFTKGDFVSADIPVRLNMDMNNNVLSAVTVRLLESGEQYVVTAYSYTPTKADLIGAVGDYPSVIKSTYLRLPADFSEDIAILSEYITKDATTTYEKVQAVVNYLADYKYSLEVDAPTERVDNVERFLFTSKEGYCLHFASAAALMLRSVGVPTRLAIGYLPGEVGKIPFQFIISDKCYHAWTQAYFPGYGWVDVETTPAGPTNLVSNSSLWETTPDVADTPESSMWQEVTPPMMYDLSQLDIGGMGGGTTSETDTLSFIGKLGQALFFIFITALAIALVIGLVLFVRATSFRWLWRVDRNTIAYGTYVNMCRLAAMVGLIPKPQQTPLEFTTVLVEALPQDAEAVQYITRVYMENRFGGREGKLDIAEEAEILKARHIVYNALMQRLGNIRRLLAFGKK